MDRAHPRDCPTWCRRDHAASAHPDDAIHQGRPLFVSVVLRGGSEALDVVVVPCADHASEWVEVVADESRMEPLRLTPESAGRLATALAAAGAIAGGRH